MVKVSARATKQTDQTTTLCVQEVEIYLERWEVLGALVDVARDLYTDNTSMNRVSAQCERCLCLYMLVCARAKRPHHGHCYTNNYKL